ncbi:MAG: acyltransferase [Xanthomonadales bacterium]|jgi:1-acyl-sn-glycerol-3-phosphate acyltransferase|nr:acyltransferase [Xanthomonadales bacterium]
MFSTIVNSVKGALTLFIMATYTIFFCLVLFLFAIGKLLAPTRKVRDFFSRILTRLVETWSGLNKFMVSLHRRTEWDVEIPNGLDHKGCYLVACNHQSWVDILALQNSFNRKLPMLTFFIKKELIYVPFLGLAWWALDFPFMQRLSREQLAKKPGLKGKDLESARIACEKLRDIPVAMMSFPEGTRFSAEKRDKTRSPCSNLLKPKVGGIGVVLYALGDKLQSLIDVTIVYPGKDGRSHAATFWELLSGQTPKVVIRARELEIPGHLLGRNFRDDRTIRKELESWINEIWAEKDALVEQLKTL